MKRQGRTVLSAGVVRRLKMVFNEAIESGRLSAQVKLEMIRLLVLVDKAKRKKGDNFLFSESLIRAVLRVMLGAINYEGIKNFFHALMTK